MTITELIKALKQFSPEDQVRFVEYQDGQTLRWHVSIACNLEHQAKINQLWLVRNQHVTPETD